MNKLLALVLAIGLILRLVISVSAIHPDFRAVNLAASFIVKNGELLTFYDHLSRAPRTDWLVQLYHDDLFIYPPLAYLFHAVFYAVLSPLYPPAEWQTLITDIGQLRSLPHTGQLLALLKLPYLLVDLAGVLLICKFIPARRRLAAVSLWWLNPVSLYVTYAIGQFDVIISTLILLALFIQPKTPALAAVVLGLAAGFKPFPLALLPFLPGNKLKNLALGGLTYALIVMPYLSSPAFKMYALLADQSSKLLFAKLYVSGSQYLSVFIIGYAFLLLLSLFRRSLLPLWGWFLAVLLLFYSVSNFHPQWFIWCLPAILLTFLSVRRTLLPITGLIVCYALIVLSFEPSLHFGLFNLAISPYALVSPWLPTDTLVSWIRSIFAALSTYLVLQVSRFQPRAHEV